MYAAEIPGSSVKGVSEDATLTKFNRQTDSTTLPDGYRHDVQVMLSSVR